MIAGLYKDYNDYINKHKDLFLDIFEVEDEEEDIGGDEEDKE